MNNLEHKMVDALIDLKENHCVSGIKAEFEAEGTRLEEALRLKEVVAKAELDFTIKIGGCEAIRDMYECRTIGVQRIVAPMIESAYALKKFILASQMAFPKDELEDINLVVNIETIQGINNFDQMVLLPESKYLSGIVMGRVDLTGSMGLTREDINCPEVFQKTKELFIKSKKYNFENAIGGGVSAHSLPFFKELPEGMLDRYETRKVIFDCPGALGKDADKGILKAVGFELLWLKNKRDYYNIIATEDELRIEMLEKRYKTLIEKAGGEIE
jgi:4-hydroxy-2-oxoheptanedioate aldolase